MRQRRLRITALGGLAGVLAVGAAVQAQSNAPPQDSAISQCVRARNVGSTPEMQLDAAFTDGPQSGGSRPSQGDREHALRQARDRAEFLARRSLALLSDDPIESVRVSVSFLQPLTLDDALQIAREAQLGLDTVSWGFEVPEAYNAGALSTTHGDGSPKNPADIVQDFTSFVTKRAELIGSRPPDSSPHVAEELATLERVATDLPVVGMSGSGLLDVIQSMAPRYPEFIWAVNEPSCGNPLVVLPEASIRVPPDRPLSSDLPPPRPAP